MLIDITEAKRIDECRQQKRVHANSLIISVFGDMVVPRGGRIWLGSLIRLLEPLSLNERLVRTDSYTELDIEKSSAGQEGHRRLGGNGVPLIVFGNEVIRGYNEAALRSTLKPWLKGS